MGLENRFCKNFYFFFLVILHVKVVRGVGKFVFSAETVEQSVASSWLYASPPIPFPEKKATVLSLYSDETPTEIQRS